MVAAYMQNGLRTALGMQQITINGIRDGVWAETGIIDKFDSPQVELKWRVPISSGYSGPTVADGRVYVSDRVAEPHQIERVHCFDWQTGRAIWSHGYGCRYEEFKYHAGPRASVLIDDGRRTERRFFWPEAFVYHG